MGVRFVRAASGAALLATVTSSLLSSAASGLPAGRAWAPFEELALSGTSEYLGLPQLQRDVTGIPYFVMGVKWDAAAVRNWNAFSWSDSGWSVGPGSSFGKGDLLSVVVNRSIARRVVALGAEDPRTLQTWLLMFGVSRDSIGQPDSIFATTSQSTEFGGAAAPTRRWAVRADNDNRNFFNQIHTFYSDTTGIWHEVEDLGVDEDHCTIAPLGDTTAVVVYAGQSGLQYAILDGSEWRETGNLDSRPFNASHPRFRIRPSGGLWLFWESFDWMHMSSYRDGVWERGDSMQFIPSPGDNYQPAWFSVDHDKTEYPLIVWNNLGFASTFRNAAVIAFPNGHGWDPPEEIPNSEQVDWVEPTATRDVNDDVWVVWRRASEGINRWSHTYCVATCAAPTVTGSGTGTRTRWVLSTAAPGSRWTIERAAEDGPFDSLATLRAGADTGMAFDDPAAGPGAMWRYRIKRESVDTRYVWRSEESRFWRPDTRQGLGLTLAAVSNAQLSFRLAGGSGALTARLYDLQGRVALERRFDASGTGEDALMLDLVDGPAGHSGVYFLRVTDATGRTTRTARVAVVR